MSPRRTKRQAPPILLNAPTPAPSLEKPGGGDRRVDTVINYLSWLLDFVGECVSRIVGCNQQMWRVLCPVIWLVWGTNELANASIDPSSDRVQQIDFICKGRSWVVRRGETLSSLAQEHGCSESNIKLQNPHLRAPVGLSDEVCLPLNKNACLAPEYEALPVQTKEANILETEALFEWSADSHSIIPKPQHVEYTGMEYFKLTRTSRIITTEQTLDLALRLADKLRGATGFPMNIKTVSLKSAGSLSEEVTLLQQELDSDSNQPASGHSVHSQPPQLVQHLPRGCNCIVLGFDPNLEAVTNNEGYVLKTSSEGVTIDSRSRAGLFYGIQTLRQLLPPEIELVDVVDQDWRIREVEIHDWPDFEWRGIMLDVSRHFFTAMEVLHVIDLLAIHKMNKFHFHLTDDHGWRLPIDKRPEIHTYGSFREEHSHLYGGAYTTTEIAEIVQYAAENFIEVIPEIDMPGHSQSLLISHPEVGNSITWKVSAMQEWGVSEYTLDPTLPQTYELVNDVLDTVVRQFPSDFIHIGGDEADHRQWQSNPRVLQLLQQLQTRNLDFVQGYFERQMSEMLATKGKRMIGWDELLRGGLPPGVIVMSWEGTMPGVQAATLGHDVIMCPMEHAYFDRKYHADGEKGRLGVMPLRDSYDWDPRTVPGMDPEVAHHVLGVQGNIWTEGMESIEDVEYLSAPRMSAIAEVGWTMLGKRGFDCFLSRIPAMQQRMEYLDVMYPVFHHSS